MNIVLIGFMGSGKTTVGKQLAINLGYRFLDTDQYIEKTTNKKIRDIFASQGEDAFRAMECGTMKDVANMDHTVIATGGGLPISEQSRIYVKRAGLVIYLKANEETLWKRLEKDHTRPLLSGNNPKEKIHSILLERAPIYQQVSDYVVEVDNRNLGDIIKEIEIIVKSA